MIKLTEEYYLVKRVFRFVRRIEKGARFRVGVVYLVEVLRHRGRRRRPSPTRVDEGDDLKF